MDRITGRKISVLDNLVFSLQNLEIERMKSIDYVEG